MDTFHEKFHYLTETPSYGGRYILLNQQDSIPLWGIICFICSNVFHRLISLSTSSISLPSWVHSISIFSQRANSKVSPRQKSTWGKQSRWRFNLVSHTPMFCWIHSNVLLVKKKLAPMLTSEPDARSGWVATLHACRLLYCAAHLWNSTKLFCVHVQF